MRAVNVCNILSEVVTWPRGFWQVLEWDDPAVSTLRHQVEELTSENPGGTHSSHGRAGASSSPHCQGLMIRWGGGKVSRDGRVRTRRGSNN